MWPCMAQATSVVLTCLWLSDHWERLQLNPPEERPRTQEETGRQNEWMWNEFSLRLYGEDKTVSCDSTSWEPLIARQPENTQHSLLSDLHYSLLCFWFPRLRLLLVLLLLHLLLLHIHAAHLPSHLHPLDLPLLPAPPRPHRVQSRLLSRLPEPLLAWGRLACAPLTFPSLERTRVGPPPQPWRWNAVTLWLWWILSDEVKASPAGLSCVHIMGPSPQTPSVCPIGLCTDVTFNKLLLFCYLALPFYWFTKANLTNPVCKNGCISNNHVNLEMYFFYVIHCFFYYCNAKKSK